MSGALAEEIGPKRCWNEFSEGRGTGLAGCGRESRRGKERSGVGTRSRGGRKGGEANGEEIKGNYLGSEMAEGSELDWARS
jgi:hypothetical protein